MWGANILHASIQIVIKIIYVLDGICSLTKPLSLWDQPMTMSVRICEKDVKLGHFLDLMLAHVQCLTEEAGAETLLFRESPKFSRLCFSVSRV